MNLALTESEKALDVIRYAILTMYPQSFGLSVGLQGAVSTNSSKIVGTGYNQNLQLLWEKYDRPIFTISNDTTKNLKAVGVGKISEILKKRPDKRTPFENTILMGLHWFADAQSQKELKNNFLSLMISLELFLTPSQEDKDKDTITNSIAESTSIILRTEDKRIKFKEKIRDFYDKRSIIVHGKKEDKNKELSLKDFEELKIIIKDLILWMLNHKHEIKSKDELLSQIKQYKLSGDTFEPKCFIKIK